MKTPIGFTVTLLAAAALSPVARASAAPSTVSAVPAYGSVWTVDTAANSLSEYAKGATGSATPVATIKGPDTKLDQPSGVAVDADGNVFVSNAGDSTITEYAGTATDDATPIATIAGAKTDLDAPSSIAYATSGEVLVTDPGSNLVEAFATGSDGDAVPAVTWSGSKTHLNHPTALAASGEEDVWVVNTPVGGTPSLESFYLGRAGDVAPDQWIHGDKTGLEKPTAIRTIGIFGDLLAVTDSGNAISIFDGFHDGHNFAPDEKITGTKTGLNDPTGLSLDAKGNLVVTNAGSHSVSEFDSSANGDVEPLSTITGVGTSAGSPSSVAVIASAPGKVTDVTAVAHDSSATVSWKPPALTGGGIRTYEVIPVDESDEVDGFVGFAYSVGGDADTKTTQTVRHLTDGTKYAFIILAENAYGDTLTDRPDATVIPYGPATAPRGVTAGPGLGSVQVFWTRPKNDGGRTIDHYRVEYAKCSPAAEGCHFKTELVGAKERHATIKGLKPGKYHLRVLAHTSLRNGKPSRVVTATAH